MAKSLSKPVRLVPVCTDIYIVPFCHRVLDKNNTAPTDTV